MGGVTLDQLRAHAATRTFFEADLATAMRRIGFVQADPIRAPARAQDLILAQRVPGYRAGDLERAYPDLSLSEDMLHVYGFLARERQLLLHPRRDRSAWRVEHEHAHLREAILEQLRRNGAMHPRQIEAALGKASIVNGWGGSSSATTRMLEALHYHGHLHVARRAAGIRVYALQADQEADAALSAPERADGLVRLLAGLYAPLPLGSLRHLLAMLEDRAPADADPRQSVTAMVARGELRQEVIDGVTWIWPAHEHDAMLAAQAPPRVRLLAPFDPVVWDRKRFALLWGWDYRFEAYTPAARRRFGYYALPILWRDAVIGWANVTSRNGRTDVQTGFAGAAPCDAAFRRAFDAELARLETFLQPQDDNTIC